jgi:ABC-type branched-subunit amino acid transport system ATPase component
VSAELLRVRDLHVGYGRGDIVKGVDLSIGDGEIVTILGPNGAGKSTLIKAIGGVVRPSAGAIEFGGHGAVGGQRSSQLTRLGISYVPQEGNVFRSLTVSENLEMGAWTSRAAMNARVEELGQTFPILEGKRGVLAGNLSGGERQMVALAMALMSNPKVLLLDEPSAGLSPRLVHTMFETVRSINRKGVAVLMVEQNVREALRISARGYVLAGGMVRIEAPASRLLDDARVAELYLGVGR